MQVLNPVENLVAQHDHRLQTQRLPLLLQQILQVFAQQVQQHHVVRSLREVSVHLG